MNTQIIEDYVSFEVAKLLKEKGFNLDCHAYYIAYADGTNKFNISAAYPYGYNFNDDEDYQYSAPTHQMAMKWLREVHKIHITVYPYGEHSCDNYQFDIYKNREYLLSKDEGYMTNEQAIEVAIKYCLTNLI